MRKLLKFMLAAVLISTAAVSCSDDDPATDNTPEGSVEADYTSKPETAQGVTITAHTTAKGFEFTTAMGLDIPTYRLDVMPYIKFQNDFFEARKANKDLTEEQYIINHLFGVISAGNAGYAMNAPFEGSWFDSKFKQAEFISGIDYVILTCGALQEDGNGVGEVNKLVVPMYKPAVTGDPKVAINLRSDYRGVEYAYTMNEDCSGYYQMVMPIIDVDAFVKEFGAEKLRDIVCCFEQGPRTEDCLPTYIPFGVDVVPGWTVAAITVGVDKNGVLARTYTRQDISLQDEKKPAAEYTYSISLLSAFMVVTDWDVDPNRNGVTAAAYHRALPVSEYTYPNDHAAEVDLFNGGFMHNSVNGFKDVDYILKPNTEYVIISTAMNKSNKLTPLRRTYFKTKPLIMDQQEQSLAQIKAEFTSVEKTAVKINYTIPSGTTVYFENAVEMGYRVGGVDVTNPETPYKTIVDLLTKDEDFFTLKAPYTTTEPGALNALEPDKKYCYFLVAEDSLGRMGPLFRKEFTTKNNLGGPNPVATIKGKVVKQSDGSYRWDVDFGINDDVTELRYELYDGKTPEGATEEEKLAFLRDIIMGDSAMHGPNAAHLDMIVTEYTQRIAIAMPFGAKGVPGKVVYLQFEPSMIVSSMLSVNPLRMNAPAQPSILKTNHTR
ncbi:MAG: hypothetical protein RR996_00945 [Alistipes sp.]